MRGNYLGASISACRIILYVVRLLLLQRSATQMQCHSERFKVQKRKISPSFVHQTIFNVQRTFVSITLSRSKLLCLVSTWRCCRVSKKIVTVDKMTIIIIFYNFRFCHTFFLYLWFSSFLQFFLSFIVKMKKIYIRDLRCT
jgi:hypothetical protein